MKIKGHTEIQVRDAKTGRMVQNTHDDNMVTNGLSEYFKNHGVLNATPFNANVRQNMITELLGGILLFNDTLDAQASNTHLADGIKMTANAAYGTLHTGDPTELGSYDANESGWQNADHTTYRFVYNWTEAQGNGVIKSAALTSRVHGIVGEGNFTSGTTLSTGRNPLENTGYNSFGGMSKPVFAIKNNTMYSCSIDTTSQEFTIYKAHVSDTEVAVNDAGSIWDTLWEEIETFANPSATQNLKNDAVSSAIFNQNSVVLLFHTDTGLLVVTLNSAMDTISSYADITGTATQITGLRNYIAFLDSTALYILCAQDQNSGRTFYKIDISNPVNTVEMTKVGDSRFNVPMFSVGKRHYGNNYVYDETLDKFIITNAATDGGDGSVICGDTYKDNHSIIVNPTGYYSEIRAGRNNAYLATINNLQNAVTKDSTQTMKVIYTLTFS